MMDNSIPISPEAQAMIDKATAALSKGKGKRTRHPGGRGDVNRARWAMLNRFVDKHMQALPIQAVAVWLALFRHADGEGGVSRALPVLARDTGLSLKSVRKGITALEYGGLLSVELKGNNMHGKYTVSCYKLIKTSK